MDVRITPQVLVARTIANARQQYDQLAVYQEQASSGQRIQRPSDDPLGLLEVLSNRAQDQRLDSSLANVSDARAKLNGSVSALTDASHVLEQARQLAIQGGSSANDATTNDALAQQVDALLGRLVDVANTQQGGQYLYGGTATQTAPFTVQRDAAGNVIGATYTGADQRAKSPVGLGQSADTFYTGSEIFQAGQPSPGNPDAFQVLVALRDDLRNTRGLNDADQAQAVAGRLSDLDRVRTSILGVVGEQSASLQNLDSLEGRMQNIQLQARQLISDRDGADLPQVIINLQAQQNLFRLTLEASGRILDQNLLDFLR